MAQLKVFWTSIAIKQRNYIFEYWNERNKSNAFSIKLNEKIKRKINLLKTHPLLGLKTDFKNTRIISIGHYSILYQKIDTHIIITGIWDNRQDPQKLLNFLENN